MAQSDDDTDGVPDLSNKEMLQILMQEIADVRYELKQDIHALDLKIDHLDQKLTKRIDTLSSEVHTLRLEVHQNQATFIANQRDLEQRVEVLESQVA